MAKKATTTKKATALKTVDIKGKAYVMVNDRIKYFREHFQGWAMVSEIIKDDGQEVVFLTRIVDDKGMIVATGHAKEKQSDGFINKTSHYENAETSSWGRALANMGIGVDASVASADEVANAIKQQSAPTKSQSNAKPKQVDSNPLGALQGDIDACKTVAEVTAIWEANKSIQDNEAFKDAIAKKGSSLR